MAFLILSFSVIYYPSSVEPLLCAQPVLSGHLAIPRE